MKNATVTSDARIEAFCSRNGPEIFRSVAFPNEVWTPDPLDVESIFAEARELFGRLVDRATSRDIERVGRILLIRGESGSGKTHLMRAFRNRVHERGLAYYGYMQMTTATCNYARYMLNKLIESLEQPYYRPVSDKSGLMRLSEGVIESPVVPKDKLKRLRDPDLDDRARADLVDDLADLCLHDNYLDRTELDLLRAMLYFQCEHPGIRRRVMKYLRCEDLSSADRRRLGDIVPQCREDAPHQFIERLGQLMWDVNSAALIVCVDQMEDMFRAGLASEKFRHAMQGLTAVSAHIPSSVVIISCLEDYYDALKDCLDASVRDRVEKDPAPVHLETRRSRDEAEQMVRAHLQHLYSHSDVPIDEREPTYPIPMKALIDQTGLRSRDILRWCSDYRERCIRAGQLVTIGEAVGETRIVKEETSGTIDLEQAWNDILTEVSDPPSEDDHALARLFGYAVEKCSEEVATGHAFSADVEDRHLRVKISGEGAPVELQFGVCNKSARGNGLIRQIDEIEEKLKERDPRPATLVLLRSTAFPSDKNTKIVERIAKLVRSGGRRVVVSDSDWRAMAAMQKFAEKHAEDPGFSSWLRDSKPLSRCASIREALELENLEPLKLFQPGDEPLPDPATATPTEDAGDAMAAASRVPAVTPMAPARLHIGRTNDRAQSEVAVESNLFTRHAGFIGASGSGKTTAALNVIEQLLLQNIPVILVDRKGDLCAYASDESWSIDLDDQQLIDRRARLRKQIDVAVYTPGHPDGRPIVMPVVPAGMDQLRTFERERSARQAANSLAEMLAYRSTASAGQQMIAIMQKAIEILARDARKSVSLQELLDFIYERDPVLLKELGKLDVKKFDKLVDDLQALAITKNAIFADKGAPLDGDLLFGRGKHAVKGRTRLTVISTKFLGDRKDVQFWVAQLLIELGRWMSREPRQTLRAAVLFDEADIYLPATSKPSTKEPMEDLIKRARSAGLGIFLATQSPGDFDYKCRDNVHNWFIGQVKEEPALRKLKHTLSDCRLDVGSKLPNQVTGEFLFVREASVTSIKSARSVIETQQLAEGEILSLALRHG